MNTGGETMKVVAVPTAVPNTSTTQPRPSPPRNLMGCGVRASARPFKARGAMPFLAVKEATSWMAAAEALRVGRQSRPGRGPTWAFHVGRPDLCHSR
eukprot:CAMPEP_0177747434 /NCGR_PEP_ID=MMETSP0484_2-20121128/31396_1 /TAXON_ID=354590 /ORGANISM="Rhodomonas lens, Strain RHODO" /LENGTH=96 /DNA_ID=CAMNT_0019262241 /DNA_START=297 /DNA_END=584 /DNA_ORIENTATION=-